MIHIKFWILLIFSCIINIVSAHHDEQWNMLHHGIFRAFFGGFFSTLTLIIGVLVFYHFCMRGGELRRMFPIFPKKPIIPITIPFARAPNYIDSDRPETIVLTSASYTPSVFYSNAPTSSWQKPISTSATTNAGPMNHEFSI